MPIYALSHNHYIIMYMCQLTIPSEKEISATFFTLITLKRMHFCKAKQVEKDKNKLSKLLKPIQVLTDW